MLAQHGQQHDTQRPGQQRPGREDLDHSGAALSGGPVRVQASRQRRSRHRLRPGPGPERQQLRRDAVGWPSGHKFGDLVGSDHAGIQIKDASGVVQLSFNLDWTTPRPSTKPHGWRPLQALRRGIGIRHTSSEKPDGRLAGRRSAYRARRAGSWWRTSARATRSGSGAAGCRPDAGARVHTSSGSGERASTVGAIGWGRGVAWWEKVE